MVDLCNIVWEMKITYLLQLYIAASMSFEVLACFKTGTEYTNLTANILVLETVFSAKDCQLACTSQEGCVVFTWMKSPLSRCWLKSDNSALSVALDPETISGPRVCASRLSTSPELMRKPTGILRKRRARCDHILCGRECLGSCGWNDLSGRSYTCNLSYVP